MRTLAALLYWLYAGNFTERNRKAGNRSVNRASPKQRRRRVPPFGMRCVYDRFIPMKPAASIGAGVAAPGQPQARHSTQRF